MANNTYTRRINLYINDKEVKNNIQSIQKEFYKANNELKGMEVGSKEYTAQMAKVKSLKGILAEHNKQLTTTQTKTQKLIGAAKGMLPAMGWAAVAAGAVKAAKKVAQFVDETFKMRQQVQKLTGLTGKDLADMTAGLKSSADTFKKDFEQLAIANNAFAQSMGISQKEANKLINDGFLAGADASGEFLAQLKEYGPQFAAAGLSAEQAIVLMSQSATEGLFSDKGADSIKEATLRLREMPTSTKEALEGIGISSQQMMNQLANSEITVFEAIQQVSRKLGELPPQSSQVGTAIADIFGGAGEDAGLEFIKMLGTAETSMEELKKRTGETGETQEMLLDANQQLNKAWSDLVGVGSGGFDKMKAKSKLFLAEGLTGLVKGIQSLRNWFIDFYNKSAPLRAWLGLIGVGFKTQINIASGALKTFWAHLKTIGNAVKAIFSGGSLRDRVQNVKEAFSKGWEDAGKVIDDTREKQSKIWNDFKEQVENGHIELPPIEQEINVTTNQPTGGGLVGSSPGKQVETIDPIKALELGFEREKLLLQKQYAEKEELDKEFKARMLANELAYLNAKLEFTTEEEARLELEQKILKTQTEYNQAIKDATIPLLEAKEATNSMNAAGLETDKILAGNTKKINDAARELEAYQTQQQNAANGILSVSNILADGIYGIASDSEGALKEMGKRLLLFALEQLKVQAQLAAAGATVQSLAQPDSIVTFGASGLVRAALIVGLIEAAFAGLEGLVNSFEIGGFTPRASSDSQPVGVVHANEWVASAPLLRDPEARAHIDFLQQKQSGFAPRFNTATITRALSGGYRSGGFTPTSPSNGLETPAATNDNTLIFERLLSVMQENTRASRELARKKMEINTKEVFDQQAKYEQAIKASEY